MKKSFYEKICAKYEELGTMNAVMRAYDIDMAQVRKCLITAGVYKSVTYVRIRALQDQGLTPKEIRRRLSISKTCYSANTPYDHFDREEPTKNALKVRACRERKKQNEQRQKKET